MLVSRTQYPTNGSSALKPCDQGKQLRGHIVAFPQASLLPRTPHAPVHSGAHKQMSTARYEASACADCRKTRPQASAISKASSSLAHKATKAHVSELANSSKRRSASIAQASKHHPAGKSSNTRTMIARNARSHTYGARIQRTQLKPTVSYARLSTGLCEFDQFLAQSLGRGNFWGSAYTPPSRNTSVVCTLASLAYIIGIVVIGR